MTTFPAPALMLMCMWSSTTSSDFFGKVPHVYLPSSVNVVVHRRRLDCARADGRPGPEMGTPEQRAACGPDISRFCKTVKPEDGPFGYLSCLQDHREKLRAACLKVLESNGQ